MLILAVAALFVIGGLYIRRQYGGGALAGLWAATTLVMAATSSAGFLLLLTRFDPPAIANYHALSDDARATDALGYHRLR